MERSQIEARLNDLDRESEKLVQEHNRGVRLKSVATTANEEAEAILIIDKVASQLKPIFEEIRQLNFQLDGIDAENSSGGTC